MESKEGMEEDTQEGPNLYTVAMVYEVALKILTLNFVL